MWAAVSTAGPALWFVILLAAYPIVETLYSIYRRKILQRTPSMEPDALHMHSLFYHRVALPAEQSFDGPDHDRANSSVAPRLWLHGALCCILALAFHDSTPALITSLGAYAILYHWQYRILARLQSMDPVTVLSGLVRQPNAGGD
jgi:UDP-N-acetylmuramyl pentapeptide phosphotransferase/UDP-N-acetylglucosamine-1-phosphate transferase